MGSWYYLWGNGAVSFVSAPTKMDAVIQLDEIGAAELEKLKPMNGGFFVTYKHTKIENPDLENPWKEKIRSEKVIAVLVDLEKPRKLEG